MEKKRLVIDLEEAAHSALREEARQHNLTASNYVRQALRLPLEQQGVRPTTWKLVRPSIEDTPEFHLVRETAAFQVWIPGPASMLYQIQPTPRLIPASYVGRPQELARGQDRLQGPNHDLMLDVAHPFGPPYRAVRLFVCEGVTGKRKLRPPNSVTYLAATSRGSYVWLSDLERGKPGFIVSGLPNAPDLWQIQRCEPDAADRCVFVLSPVRPPHGLPAPDFSRMGNAMLRAEAQQHWKNLEDAVVAHNAYALVNSAASLSEALLGQFLGTPGRTRENLAKSLEKLRQELEGGHSAFSWLDYHFMHAFRIMHQSTQHPGRVAAAGRPVRPGLALTMAEAMVEVLASVGMVQQ